MEIEQVAEMARAVAALPQAERDYFDGMLADVRAEDAAAKRIAKLRALGDLQALDFILKDARRGPTIFDLDMIAVAKGLVEAGFVREEPKLSITFIFPEGHKTEIFGSKEALGCVKAHLCDAIPGLKYSKGA